MNFTINRNDFLRGVETVLNSVDKKSTIPAINGIMLHTDYLTTTLELQATNLERSMKAVVPATSVNQDEPVVLPAQKLHDILRTQPDGQEIEITIDETYFVTLKGKGRFKIAGLTSTDFPTIPDLTTGTSFRIAKADLLHGLKNTLFAVSKDESRYALTGVHCELWDDGFILASTDGHRLCESATGPSHTDRPTTCILPGGTASEVKKLCTGDGDLLVSIGETQIGFQDGETVLVSRLIDAGFPDYRQVYPVPTVTATVNAAAYTAALRRVSLLSPDTRNVAHYFTPGELTLKANDPNLGESSETLQIDCDAEITTGYNFRYLLDILSVLTSETLTIGLVDGLSPGLFSANDGERSRFVVMPMRI